MREGEGEAEGEGGAEAEAVGEGGAEAEAEGEGDDAAVANERREYERAMKELHAKTAWMQKAGEAHLRLAEEEAREHTRNRIEAKKRHAKYTKKFHTVADRVRMLKYLGAFHGEDHPDIGNDDDGGDEGEEEGQLPGRRGALASVNTTEEEGLVTLSGLSPSEANDDS